jgi:hypothetical protein
MIQQMIRIDGTTDIDLGRVQAIRYELEADGATPVKAFVHGLRFVKVVSGFNAVMLAEYIRTRVHSVHRVTGTATMTDYFVANCESITYTRDAEGKVISATAIWPDATAEPIDDADSASQIYQRLARSGAIAYHLTPAADVKAKYDAQHAPPEAKSP